MTDNIMRQYLPPHKASLSLVHNQHKDFYITVKQELENQPDLYDWVSDEQKQKAIVTNEYWYIQWYPDTPVGFYTLAACDLDALLEALAKLNETSLTPAR